MKYRWIVYRYADGEANVWRVLDALVHGARVRRDVGTVTGGGKNHGRDVQVACVRELLL